MFDQAASLTAPPGSAPRLPRSPRSSAPATPSSSSTTATPCSARRASPATQGPRTPGRATPAEPPRTGPDTSEGKLQILEYFLFQQNSFYFLAYCGIFYKKIHFSQKYSLGRHNKYEKFYSLVHHNINNSMNKNETLRSILSSMKSGLYVYNAHTHAQQGNMEHGIYGICKVGLR